MWRILIIAGMGLALEVQAGTIYETAVRDLRNNTSSTVLMQVEGGKMRVEQGSGKTSETALIYRDDTIYALDPKEKTYLVIDRATIKRVADTVGPALKQMQEQLADLPPAQRAMLEAMMGVQPGGSQKKPPPEIRVTDRTNQVAGYKCKVVEVTETDVVLRELCVAAPAALKGGQELYDVAVKMSALVEEMLQTFDAPWMTQAISQQVENYGKLGGVPVLTRAFEAGKSVNETTLKNIRKATVAPVMFEIPADFKQKEVIKQ